MEQEEKRIQNQIHPLQKPLMVIAAAVLFSGVIVAGSIVFSSGIKDLLSGNNPVENPVAEDSQESVFDNSKKTEISLDEPILGDVSKTKLAIVEFSDFECPFCKRFHQETFDKLVKEYVDTNKAVIMYRDFPLSFHEPMASKEAFAANCVQKIAGDKAYFSYNKALFENTGSNGKGVGDEKLIGLAEKSGVKPDDFNSCMTTYSFVDEIEKDQADGDRYGVTGTPAFVIGILKEDGSIEDPVKLVGAQPFESFKKVLDEKLR